jgi:hypothetical protein
MLLTNLNFGEHLPSRTFMNNGKKKGRSLAAPAFLLPYSPECVEVEFSEVLLQHYA